MLEMRTSERGSLKRCAQQWYWSQVEGLRPNREANPLWFGSAVHEALAEWYQPGLKRGAHPVETFENVLDGERVMLVTSEDEEKEYVDARTLGIDMLTRYVELYGEDSNMFFIATERKGAVVLPRPEMQIYGRKRPKVDKWLTYHFTWDGVFRDLEDGQIYLAEHKTAAAISTLHLPLDDQAGSYWAVADVELHKDGTLKRNEGIVGIRYNFLRKALQDLRPRNADGYYTNNPVKADYIDALYNFYGEDNSPEEMDAWEIDLPKMSLVKLQELAGVQNLVVLGATSKSQPPAYFLRENVYRTRAERATQIDRIQKEGLFSEAYREGFLPITKAPSRDCSWCKFSRMCELDEQGDQAAVEDFKETMFHVEDPYLVYQKSAE